jgi:hypothetical protein
LQKEHKLMVVENMALKKISVPKRDEVTGSGEKYKMRSFMIFTAHRISFG